MDKVSQFREQIYDSAIEKQALFGTLIKGVAESVAKNGLGATAKNVGMSAAKSGIGTKMAVGAGAGAIGEGLRTPQQGEDRSTNMIKGMFGGAALGAMAHGMTSGFRAPKVSSAPQLTSGATNVTTPENAVKMLNSPGMNANPNGSDFITTSGGRTFAKDQLVNADFTVASEIIDKLFMEKMALFGLGGAAAKTVAKEVAEDATKGAAKEVAENVVEGAVKKPGFLTKTYNSVAGKPIKNAIVGAGLGGAIGTTKYNEANDDGTFGKSRFGGLAAGMAAGAGAGMAAGIGLRPIKTASCKDFLNEMYMSKVASNPLAVAGRGIVDAVDDYRKLDETTRMAIGAGLGSTINIIKVLKEQKGKTDLTTKDKISIVGKAGLEGAAVGSFFGSITGVPGK